MTPAPALPSPQFFTTADGFSHAFYDLNPAGRGRPIVLQHGFSATTGSEWVECGIAKSLAALGRPLIGIDALGHGASDRPHDSAAYGEARMATDIAALVTHLGIESYDLVGYSMGAVIALLVATADKRLHRLAVGGVGEGVVACGGVDRRVLDNRLLAEVLRSPDQEQFPPAIRGFRTGAEARGNDPLALAAHADVVHTAPIPLENIAVSTLLIAGDTDPLAARPQILADAIPYCRLELVPGDHLMSRLHPQFTALLAAFLA